MSNLTQRIATGLIFAAIGVGAILLHRYAFYALVVVLQGLTLWEFYTVTHSKTEYTKKIWIRLQLIRQLLAAVTMISFIAVAEDWLPPLMLVWIPAIWGLVMVVELISNSHQPVVHVGLHWAGLLYVTLPFALFMLVPGAGESYEYGWILGLLFMIWANDVFAYFIGRAIGRHKLAPNISPKKTVEGLVGGAVATVLMGVGNYHLFGLTEYIHWLVLSGMIVVFGTLGDLAESMLKRNLHIKDSGTILPGHGGFLDRFDGLLFALPPVTAYILSIQ